MTKKIRDFFGGMGKRTEKGEVLRSPERAWEDVPYEKG